MSNIINLPLNYSILATAFYQGDDVVKIARLLVGKLLVSNFDGVLTAISTPRVGVDYAGEDAKLLFRFLIKGHPNVSAKNFTTNYTKA